MTVDEVQEWVDRYHSDVNAKPLLNITDKSSQADQDKYNALTEEEKAEIVDSLTGATMSVQDPHGDIVGAIKEAYENRVPFEVTEIAAEGFGMEITGRIGAGDSYSMNQPFAYTTFDKEGRILSINIDQYEISSGNEFTAWPNSSFVEGYDMEAPSIEDYRTTVNNWLTKREKGDKYTMPSSINATWVMQVDSLEATLVGKTTKEVREWYETLFSDVNGKPLKITDDSSEEDKAKYDALTQE